MNVRNLHQIPTQFLRLIKDVRYHAHLQLSQRMSDELYIRIKYYRYYKRWPNLDNPQILSEKVQWLKLHDRKPIYHQMVDKVEVKKFITERLGAGYVFDTLGVWDSFDDIDFDDLPEEFVLKGTHDSGSVYICKDKKELLRNRENVKTFVQQNFGADYYLGSREYPYKGLRPRLIAEPLYKSANGAELLDYRLLCFNGEPRVLIITRKLAPDAERRMDFYDLDGTHQEWHVNERARTEPGSETVPEPPAQLAKMIEIARILAKDTHFLRVDFYEINAKLYVGELTFFDWGGFVLYQPKSFEEQLNSWLILPRQ